jgi:hypothetical protein
VAPYRRLVKCLNRGPRMPISEVTMTEMTLPSAGTLVELTATDDPPLAGVRVVATGDGVVTLSVALADVPPGGGSVTLRWPAGPRGRYALHGTVVTVDGNRVDVAATGEPEVEQQRNFVRGGGGEEVLLRRPGCPDVIGWIRDISEQGVRAHFADIDVCDGDPIRLRIQLGADMIEADAVAAKVATLRQTVPQRGPLSVELVAVLAVDEVQAQVIRRYVLRHQLLTRTRTAG